MRRISAHCSGLLLLPLLLLLWSFGAKSYLFTHSHLTALALPSYKRLQCEPVPSGCLPQFKPSIHGIFHRFNERAVDNALRWRLVVDADAVHPARLILSRLPFDNLSKRALETAEGLGEDFEVNPRKVLT